MRWQLDYLAEFLDDLPDLQKLRMPIAGHRQNLQNPLAATDSAGFPEFDSLPGTADLEHARIWNRYVLNFKTKGNHE
jgi:hypothetical protein